MSKIRRLLLLAVPCFGAGFGLTFYFRKQVFSFLLAPAQGHLSPFGGLPVYTDPTEMFSLTFGLATKAGLVVAIPIFVVGAFAFFGHHLGRHRCMVALFLPAIVGCFLGGAAFAYFVMVPTGMRYLLGFGEGIAVPVISISTYIGVLTTLVLWVGVIFELPIVMFLLAKTGLVSRRRMIGVRKIVPASAFVFGVFITPTTDWFNLTMVAVPMILLYEFGVFLAWIAEGGHMVIWRIISGFLRRIVILILSPVLVLIGVVYVIGLIPLFIWRGNLSTELRLDSVYKKVLMLWRDVGE